MDKPSVTFLIAAFNAESSVAAAIESTLTQDYQGTFRTVLVDDGSVDNTYDIARSYPIQSVRLRVNHGRAGARNAGLLDIETDFVAIQDADDISRPERLSITLDRSRVHTGTDVLGGHVEQVDPSTGVSIQRHWPCGDAQFLNGRLLSGYMPFPHPTLVVRTALLKQIGGFAPFSVAEDLDLMIRLGRLTELWCSGHVVASYMRPRVDDWRYLYRTERARRAVMRKNGLSPERLPPVVTVAEERLRQRMRARLRR